MKHEEIILRFKALNLIENGKPISRNAFKKLADIHTYTGYNGHRIVKKVLYIGHPKKNMFGFYVCGTNNKEAVEQAYQMFNYTITGDMHDYDNGYLQWGNCGIPIGYGDLRVNNNVSEDTRY